MARDLRLRDHLVHGRVVAHEETYTLADYLLRKYQRHPQVQFIYECSPIGEMSRMRMALGSPYTPICVSSEADAENGSDLVGTLILLKDGRAWSTGFDCSQFELADSIKSFSNATAWYVSCGILASILFIREFPSQGAGFPEDFDIRFNQIVIRNFESFVTEQPHRHVVSRDESGAASVSAPYPSYECENHYERTAQSCLAADVDCAIITIG
jgi:homospermidine synthase